MTRCRIVAIALLLGAGCQEEQNERARAPATDAAPPDAASGDADPASGDAVVEPSLEPPCAWESAAIPADAYRVGTSDASAVEQAIANYDRIALESGSYAALPEIRLRSGLRLYALGATSLPRVVVPAGTERALVRGVSAPELVFEPGAPSRYNCFERMSAHVISKGATLERNAFVDFSGSLIEIDNSSTGRAVNNRFVRIQSHGAAQPTFTLLGNAAQPSGGNVLFWLNALTPSSSRVVRVEEQLDFTLLGVDIEAPDSPPDPDSAIFVRSVGRLRAESIHGSVQMRALDLQAARSVLYDIGIQGPAPRLVLRAGSEDAAILRSPGLLGAVSDEGGGLRLHGLAGEEPPALTQTGGSAEALRELVLGGAGTAWELPTFPEPVDASGPSWAAERAGKPDESAAIQALIEANGVARLEPRIYYVSKPIRLDDGQGLVGAGEGATAIVATNPEVDLIEVVFSKVLPLWGTTGRFTLADLTLQGGRHGVAITQPGVQVNLAVIDHVTFRDLSGAGMFFDGIYGVDNNLFAYLSFLDSPAAIRLRHSAAWPSGASDDYVSLSYMDKTVFYRNRYVRCAQPIDIQGYRTNNANTWFESSFSASTLRAFSSSPDSATRIASSELVDNHGDPVIASGVEIYNSVFRAGPAVSLIGHGSRLEGVRALRGSSSSAVLVDPTLSIDPRDSPPLDLRFSGSVDLPLGPLATTSFTSLLAASRWPGAEMFAGDLLLRSYATQKTPDVSDDLASIQLLLTASGVADGTRLLTSR